MSGSRVRLSDLRTDVNRIVARLAQFEAEQKPAPRSSAAVARPPADLPADHKAMVRQLINERRRRARHFDPRLFGEPVWDMLIDLYAAELERASISVSSLCLAAAVPPTTALRHIQSMQRAGMLERLPDPYDKRRSYLRLAPCVREQMRSYIQDVICARASPSGRLS